MFIGRLKSSPEDVVLVSGKQMFEMWGDVLHADAARIPRGGRELAPPI
jgi:hypothetical protein